MVLSIPFHTGLPYLNFSTAMEMCRFSHERSGRSPYINPAIRIPQTNGSSHTP